MWLTSAEVDLRPGGRFWSERHPNATVRDLGFETATGCGAIYARAQELGLGLVSAAVGPLLRLRYPWLPEVLCVFTKRKEN